MTDSWEDAVPAAPLAAVSLKDDAPAPAAANNDDDDWFADQRRNTDKAEKRERKAGAPKILKRVSSKGELPTKPQRRSPTQTDAEREQAYAAARARIFAEEAAAPAPASKKKGGADWASAALSAAARTPSSEDLRAAAPAPAPGPDPDVARGPSGAGFDPKARERTRENARRGPQPRQQRRPSHRRVTEDDGDPDYRRNNQPSSTGDGYGVYDGRPGYASTREEYYARPPPQYGAQPPPPQYGAQPDAYAYPPPQNIARGPPPQNIAFGGYGFQPPPQMPEDYGARAFGGGAGFAPYTPAPPPVVQEPQFRPPPPPPQFRAASSSTAAPALAPPEAGGNPHGLMTLGDFSASVAAPAPAPSKNSGRGRGRRARGRGRGRTKGKPRSYENEFPTL